MALSSVFRIVLLCAVVAASVPLAHAGCTTADACPAGQCCGGVVLGGKCRGIGCTCFCPATNGNFGCMRDASKFLVSNPSELAKCGKAAQRSVNLAQGCAAGDGGACKNLAKQLGGIGRKM